MSDLERFEEKYIPEPNSGCWLWLAGISGQWGYGAFSAGGRVVRAHRWSYEHFVGPIPDDLVIDHLCRVPICVNPDHMEPVTNRENILRGIGQSALNAKKEYCKRGHEFTGENTNIDPRGWRVCRACDRERWYDRKAKEAEAA